MIDGWVLFDEAGPLATGRDRWILDDLAAGIYSARRTGVAGVEEQDFQQATEEAAERDRPARSNSLVPAGTLAVEEDLGQFMALYDALPRSVREMLAGARVDWSTIGAYNAIHAGIPVEEVLASLAGADFEAAAGERWLNPEGVDR